MLQAKFVEKIKTQILCTITFFSENYAIYEIMWKKFGRSRQIAVRRIRCACWITKATNTHSEYVILIAFPLQQ